MLLAPTGSNLAFKHPSHFILDSVMGMATLKDT
jgi:hypothetical protein